MLSVKLGCEAGGLGQRVLRGASFAVLVLACSAAAEAVLGHGWGTGLGGYVAAGSGLGWVFLKPDGIPLIPFVEYRTRFPFRSQQRADSRIEIAVAACVSDGYRSC